MKKNIKRADGLSTVIIVVATAALIIGVFVPSIMGLLDKQALSSQKVGSQLNNVAAEAIAKG